MGHQENPAADSRQPGWSESAATPAVESEFARLNAVRLRAAEETAAAIARQLNGPLTALLLYMGEIKHHSDRLASASGDRAYLQRVVENALAQTERVCAVVKEIAGTQSNSLAAQACVEEAEAKARADRGLGSARSSPVVLSPAAGHKPLTKREREVLRLISEGCSNKQGALRMRISPRTFESHRAEAMRKLGARNTADLVRVALSRAID
jgi:DNA-binding CsgD family transcriptional regulator